MCFSGKLKLLKGSVVYFFLTTEYGNDFLLVLDENDRGHCQMELDQWELVMMIMVMM